MTFCGDCGTKVQQTNESGDGDVCYDCPNPECRAHIIETVQLEVGLARILPLSGQPCWACGLNVRE